MGSDPYKIYIDSIWLVFDHIATSQGIETISCGNCDLKRQDYHSYK